MIVTLLGAPGSGKGTQGRWLATRLGASYVSSGDVLRRAIARGTALGRNVQRFVERGALVPDDVLVPVVMAEVTSLETPAQSTGGPQKVVLDGFPRTCTQAEAFDRLHAGSGMDAALLLRVPDEVVVARLAARLYCDGCGSSYSLVSRPPRREALCDGCDDTLTRRADDAPETVRHRLTLYAAAVQPLTDYYRLRGRLAEVDGDGEEECVAESLYSAVKPLVGSRASRLVAA